MRWLFIVLILFLTACKQPSNDGTMSGVPAGATDLSVTYQCDSGNRIRVAYPTDSTAVVEIDGHRHQMSIAVSGSGARYVGERLEWWSKGSGTGATGTLFHRLADGTTGEAIERCLQVEAVPGHPQPGK